MTITTEKAPLNGVDTATLFATLDAVKQPNEIAKFQFRATQQVGDRHAQPLARSPASTARTQEMQHKHDDRGRHRPPGGAGRHTTTRPTPVEYLLHAIAACLTAGHRQHRRRPRRPAHPRVARPSRATSTCSASSGSPTARSATATSSSR